MVTFFSKSFYNCGTEQSADSANDSTGENVCRIMYTDVKSAERDERGQNQRGDTELFAEYGTDCNGSGKAGTGVSGGETPFAHRTEQ